MFPSFRLFLAISSLIRLSTARAVWIPDELQHDAAFWVPEDFSPLAKRADTCGGDTSLTQCGNALPSDFCCGAGTTCLLLNTTSTIQAALCCPAGQDCRVIAPVGCDQNLQNATAHPSSQLHSQPPTELQSCGTSCCPMGYTCQNSVCQAQTKQEAASSSLLPTSTAGLATSTASSSASTTASSSSGATITPLPVGSAATKSDSAFSGKSFAAGFVPGIVLGSLVAAVIIFCLIRRERKKSRSYVDEKHYSSGRDTLTDLGPSDMHRRPTFHGRSISEPTADASMGHRTDFLNSTPPRGEEQGVYGGPTGYLVHVESPANASATPSARNPPKQKAWLSHSPFVNQARSPVPTQSPVPAHLKRGTLSFSISPVRALKKQRSMHSLRRQMTTATDRSNSSRRQHRPDASRSGSTGSTETIKVVMDTPRQQPPPRIPLPANSNSAAYRPPLQQQRQQQQQPPASAAGTWVTTASEDSSTSDESTPIENCSPNDYTPTRPGRNSDIHNIGDSHQAQVHHQQTPHHSHHPELLSPYTPSNYPPTNTSTVDFADGQPKQNRLSGLLHPGMVNGRDSMWRNTCNTTFSSMMEKAGLRKTLLLGPDPREWNRSKK